MPAINEIRGWVGSCIEYLTTNPRDQPGYLDPEMARDNATYVVCTLIDLKLKAEKEYPHRKDVLELLHSVQMEIGGWYGAKLPDEVLRDWYYAPLTVGYDEEQKQQLCKRWQDKDRIKEEFRGLDVIKELMPIWSSNVPAEECWAELAQWVREWLAAKRKGTKLD